MSVLPGEVPIKPEDFLTESRAISNSEVTTYLSCKRMYEFAFILNLMPKTTQYQLKRGEVGHGAFEWYIKLRLAGEHHEKALQGAMLDYFRPFMGDPEVASIAMESQFLFKRYMDYHVGWPNWELLGTEERVDLRLTDSIVFPIRYDVMFLEKPTKKIFVGDWKFTYDFWKDWAHSLNPQMPKYISVLNANGYEIAGGKLIEIRTRQVAKAKATNPKELWKETNYFPRSAKKMELLRHQVASSLEIEEFRAQSPETRRKRTALPVLNKFGPCGYCSFRDLCISMLDGKEDLSVDIAHGYTENTYSYNKDEPNELEGLV